MNLDYIIEKHLNENAYVEKIIKKICTNKNLQKEAISVLGKGVDSRKKSQISDMLDKFIPWVQNGKEHSGITGEQSIVGNAMSLLGCGEYLPEVVAAVYMDINNIVDAIQKCAEAKITKEQLVTVILKEWDKVIQGINRKFPTEKEVLSKGRSNFSKLYGGIIPQMVAW